MKLFIKEFLHQLTGRYSDAVIVCKSYSVIQYLKEINYKPSKKFTTRRKLMSETKSNTFFIAGVKFHPGAAEQIRKLEVGEDLELVPEPDNKFDPNAVRIEYGGTLLGYVPKKLSAEISALMEIEETECLVQNLNPNAPTWEMCEVMVRPVVPEEFGDLDLDSDPDIDESDLPDFDFDDDPVDPYGDDDE